MMTETEIKLKGYQALLDALGVVQAEQFISLIIREPFDYTRWQKTLWPKRSIKELSLAAMQMRKEQPKDE